MGPDELHVRELLSRIEGEVKEIIIATNPTVEGESTASFLAGELAGKGVRITRIARGLPVGSDIELSDKVTLGRSFEGRMEV